MDPEKTLSTLRMKRATRSTVFGTICVVLVLYGLASILTVYLPVLRVEAQYQYKQMLTKLGAQSLVQLIVPQVTFSTAGNTQHREFGIVIPELGVNEPVIFNVDATSPTAYEAALQEGIAHAASTSIPDMGGIGYYFAHSSNPSFRTQYNAVFYLLGKLKGGEDIFVWHEGNKYHYRVTNSRVTTPDDVSFLQEGYTTESIVLQTCWPPGTTSKRLLVFGERVQ